MIYNVELPTHPSQINKTSRVQNDTHINENTTFLPEGNPGFQPQVVNFESNWIIPTSMMPRNMVLATGVNTLQAQRDFLSKKNKKVTSFYNTIFTVLTFLITLNMAIDLYYLFLADEPPGNTNNRTKSRRYASSSDTQKVAHILGIIMSCMWIILCLNGLAVTRWQSDKIFYLYWALLLLTFAEGISASGLDFYCLKDEPWSEKVYPLIFLIIFICVMVSFIRFSLQLGKLLELRKKLDSLNQIT
jgi:hypothetical protein